VDSFSCRRRGYPGPNPRPRSPVFHSLLRYAAAAGGAGRGRGGGSDASGRAEDLPLPAVGARVRCEGLAGAVELHDCLGRVESHEGARARVVVDGPGGRVVGRGFHSSTFQLNLSALYGIGVARGGCVARVKWVLWGVLGF